MDIEEKNSIIESEYMEVQHHLVARLVVLQWELYPHGVYFLTHH